MTTELQELLATRGYSERAAQTRLFDHLTMLGEHDGVVAQAGTGTGKSMAILAAAAAKARMTSEQSVIVTPTLTLMNQYRGDTEWAIKAFDDLAFAEVRGMSHYQCEMSGGVSLDSLLEGGRRASLEDIPIGCLGFEIGCTQKGWEGHTQGCPDDCVVLHGPRWHCGYRQARYNAKLADVVVTNSDLLIVNDRTLYATGSNFMTLDGALFVDEAHTLEQKLRDYASRSLFNERLAKFRQEPSAAAELAEWVKRHEKQSLAVSDAKGFPYDALRAIAASTVYPPDPGDSPKEKAARKRDMDIQEACLRLQEYVQAPHDSAVFHVGQGFLKMDWINVSKSAGELLRTRQFGLVSATVPKTMSAALGVADAPFIDVGHPFDYSKQAWLGFSAYAGDYRSAQVPGNFDQRVNEVRDLIDRSGGGALILFSSFRDLEAVSDALRPHLRAKGIPMMVQEREMTPIERQNMADGFRESGNAVLFGSESFATGFDVPGDALRLVIIWKLPYPAVDPVANAIRAQSYARYEDMMKVRAVQAMGRLIRHENDRGIVWFADSRGRRLMDNSDPLTAHVPQFARLP